MYNTQCTLAIQALSEKIFLFDHANVAPTQSCVDVAPSSPRLALFTLLHSKESRVRAHIASMSDYSVKSVATKPYQDQRYVHASIWFSPPRHTLRLALSAPRCAGRERRRVWQT